MLTVNVGDIGWLDTRPQQTPMEEAHVVGATRAVRKRSKTETAPNRPVLLFRKDALAPELNIIVLLRASFYADGVKEDVESLGFQLCEPIVDCRQASGKYRRL